MVRQAYWWKKVKCDFKKLGPKFGKQMKRWLQLWQVCRRKLLLNWKKNGSYTFQLDGTDAVVEAAT